MAWWATILPLRAAVGQPGALELEFNPTVSSAPSGPVTTIAEQADGKLLIGGDFAVVQGVRVGQAARLNRDGTLDPSFIRTNVTQRPLAVASGGTIYLNFPEGLGQDIRRITSEGIFDPCFQVTVDTRGIAVFASVVIDQFFVAEDGTLRLRALYSSHLDGQPVISSTRIPRLRSDGSFLHSTPIDFVPLSAGLAVQADGKLLVAGGTNILRYHASGARDEAFAVTVGGRLESFNPEIARITALATDYSGRILVGGQFTNINGIARTNLARLNADGSLDATFDAGLGPSMGSVPLVRVILAQRDGKIVVGGSFSHYNGVPRRYLARLDGGDLPGPPRIQLPPTNANLMATQPLVLPVFASGRGPLRYSWSINGVEVPDQTNAVFQRSSAGMRDTGDYRVVVANDSGAVTSGVVRVTVTAAELPQWLAQPAGTSVKQGENVFLFAGVTNVLPMTFQWTRNGADLPGASEPALFLRDVRLSQAGDYQLIARNAAGSVTSAVARITVSAEFVTADTLDQNFNLGPDTQFAGDIVGLAAQSSGRPVFSGAFTDVNNRQQYLARLLVDGRFDPSFRPWVIQSCCGRRQAHVTHSIARQADDRLLVTETVGQGLTSYYYRLHADGCLDESFQQGTWAKAGAGTASYIATETSGTFLLAGTFFTVNGAARTNLARLRPDGSLDERPIRSEISGGTIWAIAGLPGGKFVIGGNFLEVNGVPRYRVALLNPDGTVEPGFDPGPGPNGTITGVAVQDDGKIVIVGDFTNVAGVPRFTMARLLPSGAVDPTFNPQLDVSSFIGARSLYAVTADESGQILASGNYRRLFRLYGDRPVRGPPVIIVPPASSRPINETQLTLSAWVARGEGATYQWLRQGTNLPGMTNEVLYSDRISVGDAGAYQVVVRNGHGAVTSAVARVDVVAQPPPTIDRQPLNQTIIAGQDAQFSVEATSFEPPAYQWKLNGVELPGKTNALLLLSNLRRDSAGRYSVVVRNRAGETQSLEAQLSVGPEPTGAGAVDIDFYPGTGAKLTGAGTPQISRILVQPDDRIVAAGAFQSFDLSMTAGLVRLDTNGAVDLSFNVRVADPLSITDVLLQPDGRILVVQTGRIINGLLVGALGRLNPDGSVDTTFALPQNIRDVSRARLQSDQRILVAGRDLLRLVRLHTNGVADNSFTHSISNALAVDIFEVLPDDTILVASLENPNPRVARLRRLFKDGVVDPSFTAAIDPLERITSLLVQRDGKIIVGGISPVFQSGSGFLRLNPDGNRDTNFNPELSLGVEHPDGSLIRAISSFDANGVVRSQLSRRRPDGTLDPGFNPSTEGGSVRTIVIDRRGDILIGGSFTNVNGFARPGIARLYGTNLRDPQIVSAGHVTGQIRLEMNTEAGHAYVLEYKNLLTDPSWTVLSSAPGNGGRQLFIDPAPPPAQRFYRVRIE